jgi:hypothetical protein
MQSKDKFQAVLAFAFLTLLLIGCGSQAQVMPTDPAGKLNPAMSADQKQRMLNRNK